MLLGGWAFLWGDRQEQEHEHKDKETSQYLKRKGVTPREVPNMARKYWTERAEDSEWRRETSYGTGVASAKVV